MECDQPAGAQRAPPGQVLETGCPLTKVIRYVRIEVVRTDPTGGSPNVKIDLVRLQRILRAD